MTDELIQKIKEQNKERENFFVPWATKEEDALFVNPRKEDFRSPFSHDVDKILHDLSYTRYQDKTQVFSGEENDHISHRMTHVQLVSKIARTIGRCLRLNEDLIEAIALGHDIGHTPLGHSGEAMLNRLCKEELGCTFAHNVEGVRYYMKIANQGRGHNLSIQTLDGILMHNGEMVDPIYRTEKKTKEEFLKQVEQANREVQSISKYHPMTLEGCVVRISDIIAYIGRDIEDAIEIGRFKREELPKEIVSVLGDSNQKIVNTLICDLVENSYGKDYLKFTPSVFKALLQLKKFNMEHIYRHSMSKEEYNDYELGMRKLYRIYLEDIEKNRKESIIFSLFLEKQDQTYLDSTSNKRKVIDFLAGMTDDFLRKQIKNLK